MASRLNGRCFSMLDFSFEKNGKCIKLDKTNKKGAEEYTEKKVPIILGNRITVLEIVRQK